MFACRKGSTKGLTGKVVTICSCLRNSGTLMVPPSRLTTFLLTPAPAPAEMPSEKLIRVIRNFLTLSVSALSWPGEKRLKLAMPRPRLTAAIPTVLGITLWVGGTGTVHTDTGVVELLATERVIVIT